MVRLQKFLAQAGIASRRASETIIREGRVEVNGQRITRQGVQINPKADVAAIFNPFVIITWRYTSLVVFCVPGKTSANVPYWATCCRRTGT